MQLPFRTALVTGASAGIGRQYAIELARSGASELYLLARRTKRLEALSEQISELSAGRCHAEALTCDLLDEKHRSEVLERFASPQSVPDLLVNNAGFGAVGRFSKLDWQRQRDMIALNSVALTHMAHRLMPSMIERGSGTIINVASTAAFQPLPYMSCYGATKAFVFSLSLALYAEGREHGVHSIVHCPGPTDSEFHIAAGLKEKIDILEPMETEPVVAEALKAAAARRAVVINGFQNSAMAALTRFIPYSLLARIVAYKLRRYRSVGEP